MSAVVRLHDQLVMVPTPSANAYLWFAVDGLTLIDTGDPGAEVRVREALSELGRTDRDLTRIVLTHAHPDHIGGAAALAAASNAQVSVGRADAAVVRGDSPRPPAVITDAERPLFDELSSGMATPTPCPVHRELDDGDLLDAGGDAVVISVPGHTAGSIAVHLPRLRAVLTGDVAVQLTDIVTLGPFNIDRTQAWNSLQRLAALDVDIAGLGHGAPLTSRAATALATATDPLA